VYAENVSTSACLCAEASQRNKASAVEEYGNTSYSVQDTDCFYFFVAAHVSNNRDIVAGGAFAKRLDG